MKVKEDLSGTRFGQLLVVSSVSVGPRILWKCLCDCGVEKLCYRKDLKNGKISCSAFCAILKNRKILARQKACTLCGKIFDPGYGVKRTLRTMCSEICHKKSITRPCTAELFWQKVAKRSKIECWLWTAGKFVTGYGAYRWHGQAAYTHRLAWEFANGPIPPGLMICHKCDVRACCNPSHMFLGTARDNNDDMAHKGRRRGKNSRKPKVDAAKPLIINP